VWLRTQAAVVWEAEDQQQGRACEQGERGASAQACRDAQRGCAQVQRAAAGALRTLAFKNEDNKNQIVDCGALPTLIQMLRAEDVGIHYEAVGVIGNLVHSSQHIKRKVRRRLSEHLPRLLRQVSVIEPCRKPKLVQTPKL